VASGINQFVIVVGLDVEGYTNKPIKLQLAAQQAIERWVIDAALRADISKDEKQVVWVDTGDGGYLLYETVYQKVVPFLESFYDALAEHNEGSVEAARINVRAAVHCSDTIMWQGKLGRKYAGNAINVCARILGGMPRNYSNQVVCSGEFLTHLTASAKTVEPLRMPDFLDKHKKSHEVWNITKSPGFGVKPQDEDLHEDPTKWFLAH
jgi:hypothetical protein